ncbi:MAG TPA: hypothetical protein VN914_14135 [Polyangia bacterium]|nr:hypothetical protein [Polyangia bacterium]
MKRLRLPRLRISALAIALATLGWAVGCATPQPMVDPYFAARTYTPARIALMPADIFVIYDEVGDNDPRKSQALSQQIGSHVTGALAAGLQRRGYQVSTAAGWDGIRSPDGSYTVGPQEMGGMANAILQFSGSPAGGGQGRMQAPAFIAPELATRLGAATQSDSVLYVNMKGVAVSPGKRAAEVVGVVFFVVIVAAIILLIVSESKSGGHSHGTGPVASGGGGTRSVRSSGWRGPAPSSGPSGATTAIASPPPRGYGYVPPGRGPVYSGPQVGIGISVVVPIEGPAHTHEGAVAENDEYFAGDQAYLSATLVSTYDGRVLWHARQSIDVDLDKPADVQKMIDRLVESIPPSLSQGPAPAPAAH